jgi:hypothetical protein
VVVSWVFLCIKIISLVAMGATPTHPRRTAMRTFAQQVERGLVCRETLSALERVEHFIEKHGDLANVAMCAFSDTDPFHCFYGEDLNPDEYLGYAERFVKEVEGSTTTANGLAPDTTIFDLVRMAVERSFHLN